MYYTGSITNVARVDLRPVNRPPVQGTVVVLDRRFRHRDEIHNLDELIYRLEEGDDWKEATDPGLLKRFRKEWKDSLRWDVPPAWRRYLPRIILIALLVIPPVLLLRFAFGKSPGMSKDPLTGAD